MTTEQLALPTTETAKPAPKVSHGRWNAETGKPEPLWPNGTRMVFNPTERTTHNDDMAGRHGTIRSELVTMTSYAVTFSAAASARSTEHSFHYVFTSDAGAWCHVWDAEHALTPETERIAFTPDPIVYGSSMTASELARRVNGERRSASNYIASSLRRRIADKAARDRETAAEHKAEAAKLLAVLTSWLEANPGEAARLKEHKDIREALGVPTAPAAPAATGPSGASVSINEQLNGVEVRFPAKPDESTIGALKSNGFRWSMRSRCWYHRRDEASEAFARSLVA